MQIANYHAHSDFSDGHASPEIFLKKAIELNLKAYGFSDHAPLPIKGMGSMKLVQLPAYLSEINRLKEKYAGKIQVYRALEVDYLPGKLNIQTDYISNANLDYTLGAVHYVEYLSNGQPWGFQSSHEAFQKGVNEIFDGDIKACIRRYYELIREMVENYAPDIIAHLDRVKKLNQGNRYFDEGEKWYQEEISETLESIAKSGSILEINTKGYYNKITIEPYPGTWILRLANELNIPIHIASDAHWPEFITGGFEFAADTAIAAGYKNYRIFIDGIWQDFPMKKSSFVFCLIRLSDFLISCLKF